VGNRATRTLNENNLCAVSLAKLLYTSKQDNLRWEESKRSKDSVISLSFFALFESFAAKRGVVVPLNGV
jgi:hypothetical protein